MISLAIEFGFLDVDKSFSFDKVEISPVPDFYSIRTQIEEWKNKDGYLYPPICYSQNEKGDKIDNTERPAFLWRPPPSHILKVPDDRNEKEFMKDDGMFLLNLFSYLFGIRLQFCKWWFDGRISINRTHSINFTHETSLDFFSKSYEKWKSWDEKRRKMFTNLLYMHSRAPSYEWDWEAFVIEYMVFDGCYKFAEEYLSIRAKTHRERMRELCEKLNIEFLETEANSIIELRHDLFHEALWDKDHPCMTSGDSSFCKPLVLRRLNQRILTALLEYKNTYTRKPWWIMSCVEFEKATEGRDSIRA